MLQTIRLVHQHLLRTYDEFEHYRPLELRESRRQCQQIRSNTVSKILLGMGRHELNFAKLTTTRSNIQAHRFF